MVYVVIEFVSRILGKEVVVMEFYVKVLRMVS